MSETTAPRVHPSAIVSSEAQLADGVEIEAFVVIDGQVSIGAGSVIQAHARLIGPMTLGQRNHVHSGAVLGDQPQDLRYADEPTRLEIGDDNVLREHVTIHRGTSSSGLTKIGNNNFLMVGAHVAHDCVIGNGCILANGALIAGHCELSDGVYVSGNSAVHQFCRLGRLAMLSGLGATSKDIPPFVIQAAYNQVGGVNLVGMRRAGHSNAEIKLIRRAFQILYREGHLLPQALDKIEAELGGEDIVREFTAFVRDSKRGIVRTHFAQDRDKAA